jgi:hypothetical protein
MVFVVGRSYYLNGMGHAMWDVPHPKFGRPKALAGRYLGCLCGIRTWHGFEIWVDGQEHGVIFMNDSDIAKLSIIDIQDLTV